MAGKPVGSEPRNALITIRETDATKKRYTDAARADGMDLSDWFRWLAEERIAAAGKRKKRPT